MEDTGVGIPKDDLDRIFTAFEQLAPGAQSGGTGLGLAISREFARVLGGDIEVASQPDRGSRFTFTLLGTATVAAAPGAVAGRRALPVGLAPGERVRRILVADDHEANRAVICELLRRIGFSVRAVAGGESALSIADEWGPDLVLMDLKMPDIDGLEAIRRLRQAGSRAALVLFTASSLGVDGLDVQAAAAGADAVLTKPYREADLLDAIGTLLGVSYVCDESSAPAPQPDPPPSRDLTRVIDALPESLRAALRDAAASARAARVSELVRAMEAQWPDAARRVADLAREFRYDEITTALAETHPGDQTEGSRG